MAALVEGSTMANISSSTGWLVSGALSGQKASSRLSPAEESTLTYTVLTPKLRPMNTKPTTSSAMLMAKLYDAALQGRMRLSTMDMPVTPPKEKLLGNLKKYTPRSSRIVASVRIPYSWKMRRRRD